MKSIKPLRDPLLSTWTKVVVLFVIWFAGIFIIAALSQGDPGAMRLIGIPWVLSGIASAPLILCVVLMLPWRRTNALYLRSFANDEKSWPIRVALQDGLGTGFRLSGIRAPNRRMSSFSRFFNELVYVLRYSSPRYMCLEAGDDWKKRLGRSMADCKCVIVDLTDPTEFVKAELNLAFRILGAKNVLCIATDQTIDSIKNTACEILSDFGQDINAQQVNASIWQSKTQLKRRDERYNSFIATTKQFAIDLNEELTRNALDSTPLEIESIPDEEDNVVIADLSGFAFAFVVSAFFGCLTAAVTVFPPIGLVTAAIGIYYWLFIFRERRRYLAYPGSFWGKFVVGALLPIALVVSTGINMWAGNL